MKKKFVEPAMHRIELNLRENIAASAGSDEPEYSMGYYFMHTLFECKIVTTGKTIFELKETGQQYLADQLCASSNARARIKFYPREEVLPYLY